MNRKKKSKYIRIILLFVICAIGSVLFGYNGNKLNNVLNLSLYIIGLAMVSCSLAVLWAGLEK